MWVPCKGLAACAVPAQCSAALCCVIPYAPHSTCMIYGQGATVSLGTTTLWDWLFGMVLTVGAGA